MLAVAFCVFGRFVFRSFAGRRTSLKILLAIDSSPLSEAVVSEVEGRPWPAGTQICVLTVVDLFALTYSVGYLESFMKSEDHAARLLVQEVAERLARRDLETTANVVEGYPAASIVEEAGKYGADFVFVGSHGHGGFVLFFLGSVARAVVENAGCSVEIVRQPRNDDDHPDHHRTEEPRERMRILLATDGSDFSLRAAQSIAERPWPDDTEFRIASVVERVMPAANPWYAAGAVARRRDEVSAKNCEDAVSSAEQIVAQTGFKTETAVLDGNPKKRIVEDATEWGADLVVVGSHGRRGLTRYLLGSVSEAVAMRAHCSVEVIRDRTLLKSA
jgi:nucleotide-binding universal stress UspA family protein